ncbi:hypothetical protein [Niallia circulans]|uniref:hypothetical protein n=1 Tax=Niallia circulans TaxID=1397 RepID=UPI001C531F04|nr:hypothetical protein [Niallia circulans]
MKILKRSAIFLSVFSILFLGIFQNVPQVSADSLVKNTKVTEELELYLDENNIEFKDQDNTLTFSSIHDNIEYILTYYKEDGTYQANAYDVVSGSELNIQELETKQEQNGQVVIKPSTPKSGGITTMALPIVLVPVAAWVFEHLVAMAIAATIVTVVAVSKDKVKAELETRLKKKNPTIIYRGGSSTAYNLTPRKTDTGGLSYYLKMPSGKFTATTKEAVNNTKVLKAVVDGSNHVSVKPKNSADMAGWIKSKDNANEKPHKFTRILQAISVSSKN